MKTFAALLLLCASAWPADFRAGAAEVVITPPQGAPMAGYYSNRAAAGVLDDLHAKAIVLEVAGAKVALVACDVVALPREVVEAARRIVQQKTGIAASHVMISATHSHTGPVIDTQPSHYHLEGEMKRIAEEYTAALPAKIAESVVLANSKLQAAQLRSGIGQEATLPFNRRYFMQDGSVGWNPGKLNPKIVRPAGPVDPALPLLVIETPEGRAIAAYVNYSMHLDTTGGMQYSADYAGALLRILRMAKGEQLVTLFTMGTSGNVNHVDVSSKEKQSSPEEAARIGAVLAGEALKAWKQAALVPLSKLSVSSEMVPLPLWTLEPVDVEWAKAPHSGTTDLAKVAKIEEVTQRKGKALEAEVQVIALNRDIAFVGFPAEVFVELGLAVKAGSPFANTIVASLANGALGYIPNRKAYREGAYEVVSSRAAAGGGELLVDSALRQLLALVH